MDQLQLNYVLTGLVNVKFQIENIRKTMLAGEYIRAYDLLLNTQSYLRAELKGARQWKQDEEA